MKKWLAIAIVLVMSIMFAGCGNSSKQEENPAMDETSEVKQSTGRDNKIKKDKDLPLTFYSYEANLDINVPNVQNYESRLTELYVTEDETLATITTVEVDSSDDATVMETAIEKYLQGLEGTIRTTSYDVKISDKELINDYEMTRFEGIIHCTSEVNDFDLPFYGYTFYSEGYACALIGTAGSFEVQDPSSASIEYIKDLIDKMANTVRAHE